MKRYHITYFIDDQKKTLSGLTIEAENMADVIEGFLLIQGNEMLEKIKYIIEL